MPEYSTPKLTPDETTKLPGMNGSSSGYVLTSELLDIIRNVFGQANGVATLDSSGKLPTAQLPDIADDVLVYASKALLPAQGVEAKIYITTDDNVLYRWDATLGDYVQLSVDLSDYATLDDLAAEEAARETADTNLNNALTAIDHRLDNLEQAKGSYVVSNYKDGSITPSGKGNWAVVEGLRGVSRVENNLMPDAKQSGSKSFSASTSDYNQIMESFSTDEVKVVAGHTYLASAKITRTISQNNAIALVGFCSNGSNIRLPLDNGSVNGVVSVLYSPSASGYLTDLALNNFYGKQGFDSGDSIAYADCILTDLNVYFGGTIPSNADTIAKIQTNYPHLLTPSEYGTRIVDSSYSGVRAWARNIFNPQGATADVSLSSSGGTYIQTGNSTSDYLPIKPNVQYYHKNTLASGSYIVLCYYDENKAFISAVATTNATTTSPSNAKYARISYLTADVGQICVNKSDSQNGTYTPYHAPSTLSLTFTGKSAGSVREVYNLESGEVTHPIGEIDLGDLEWYFYTGAGTNINTFYATVSNLLPNSGSNALCARYICQGWTSLSTREDKTLQVHPSLGIVYVADSAYSDATAFKASVDGVVLYYESVTPDPSTFVTPIIDNTLLTEAGGRMATVQTGTVVDGSFDMGFINL